jgi:F-type H+-transporting ATPase subunit delta
MLADVIRGYAAATIERVAASDDAGRLASDVEAFSSALVSSESLRWALIDPNISPVARRSIVADLLVGRASSEAASLISFVVRVAPPAELAVAVADLVGLVESASSVGEPATSLGASRERLHGYAERVLEEVSSAADIDEMEDAFFRLARIVEQSASLRHALTDPGAAMRSKLAIISELFGAQVTAPTLRIVSYAISAGRVRDLVGAFDWLVQLTAEERGRRVAQVRSAVDLDDAERERLAVALRHLVGREVEVRVTVDPMVIGGVLIAVGDLVIDGTVRLRVERLRDALAESA